MRAREIKALLERRIVEAEGAVSELEAWVAKAPSPCFADAVDNLLAARTKLTALRDLRDEIEGGQ